MEYEEKHRRDRKARRKQRDGFRAPLERQLREYRQRPERHRPHPGESQPDEVGAFGAPSFLVRFYGDGVAAELACAHTWKP